MISSLFHSLVYVPLYNGLIFFVDVVPAHDVGLSVIALTALVRIAFFPLSERAIRTQHAMRALAPEIEALKEKYKDRRDEQARALFALYREKNVRPFSTVLIMLVQLPILFGLYFVFWRGGLPAVDPTLLYAFVSTPNEVNMFFLSSINMAEQSVILAALAGITQLLYARLSMGPPPAHSPEKAGTFAADFAKSMDLQMRYVLPIMIGGIAYTIAAAVPLYWTANNVFMIAQELLMRRRGSRTP